jgi:hypothetical protein
VTAKDLQRLPSPWPNLPFRISYIGAVRNAPENIAFVDAVYGALGKEGATDRLEVHFIGAGLPASETAIREHCQQRGYERVHFHGRYCPEDATQFYEECHFVLALYGHDTPSELTLTPNRLYHSAIHRRPIIVSEGTHLARLVRKHGLGVVFTGDGTTLKQALDVYRNEAIYAAFAVNCSRFLTQVSQEIESFDSRLLEALRRVG